MKCLIPALAALIACLPCGLTAQVTLTEDFEGSAAGSGTPPAGWTLVGLSGGTPGYATSAAGQGSDGSGGSAGLAGQASSSTTPSNTEFPGAYLVNGQDFSMAHSLTGTFDFLIVNEATSNDDVGFIIGAVGDGVTGVSEGELLYVRLTEGNNSAGGILQDGDGGSTDRVQVAATTFSNNIWYRATVSWTPTGGTTGNFSFVVKELASNDLKVTLQASGFTFDSAVGQIGFGSINDTIRFDNVNFTGAAVGTAIQDLNLKIVSADPASNVDLLLSGSPSSSYFVYRSGDLKGPLYRKRWEQRFAGAFPVTESEIPLQEPVPGADRAFYVATQVEPKARIMCVGDSITEGGTTFFVYRPALHNLLVSSGYRFEFVGSRTNTQDGLTLKHEGYGGKNATEIAGFLSGTFPNHIADIVLIHAGHNYFADVQGEASIVNEVEAATRSMIATARTHNPDVIVLLAQVITSTKLPKYSYIPALNVRLAEVAADLHTEAQPVIIVNQADGWDPVADTVDDQVHPTAGGATKMANKWFAALQPLLE